LPKTVWKNEGESVRKLQKALYGYVRSPKLWFQKFATTATAYGFVQCERDQCLYLHPNGTMMIVHVDDGVISGPDMQFLEGVWDFLTTAFKI
jgi:hypothetical protein